jgi:pilus assembly protein CpaC
MVWDRKSRYCRPSVICSNNRLTGRQTDCSGYAKTFLMWASHGMATITIVLLSLAMTVEATAQQRLVVEVGKGLRLDRLKEAESIFVADTNIADISASPGDAHFIYGKSAGETSVIAADISGQTLLQYDLIVVHNLVELRRMLSRRFGDQAVYINSARGSIFISGTVSDERTRQNILSSLDRSVPGSALIDELIVAQGNVIELHLRFVEVARERLEEYGIDWSILTSANANQGTSTTNSLGNIDVLLSLLLANGVATNATESTLTTVSNRKAEFWVGDEIAIPTFTGVKGANSEIFSIDFKFVGSNVDFLPTLLPGGRINLQINTTVSSIQPSARMINGNSFPNLASRRFSANVELGSGEGFVIASLSRMETLAHIQKPRDFLGGNLVRNIFGHDRIEAAQRDMLVVVTPRFGGPVTPTVNQVVMRPKSNLEYILSHIAEMGGKSDSKQLRLFGPSGFLY